MAAAAGAGAGAGAGVGSKTTASASASDDAYFAQFDGESLDALGAQVATEVRRIGMGKISCPFRVEYSDRKWKAIHNEFVGGALSQRVLQDGVATVKYDGMNCLKLVLTGAQGQPLHVLCLRYDQKLSKKSKQKLQSGKLKGVDVNDPAVVRTHFNTPPPYFVPTEQHPDPVTFHFPGYVPIFAAGADSAHQFEQYLRESFHSEFLALRPHTYELVGPDVNANVHQFPARRLLCHGAHVCPPDVQKLRTLDALLAWFRANPPSVTSEGIVWHLTLPASTAADGKATDAKPNNTVTHMVKLTRAHCGLAWLHEKHATPAAATAADSKAEAKAKGKSGDSSRGGSKSGKDKDKHDKKQQPHGKDKAADTKSASGHSQHGAASGPVAVFGVDRASVAMRVVRVDGDGNGSGSGANSTAVLSAAGATPAPTVPYATRVHVQPSTPFRVACHTTLRDRTSSRAAFAHACDHLSIGLLSFAVAVAGTDAACSASHKQPAVAAITAAADSKQPAALSTTSSAKATCLYAPHTVTTPTNAPFTGTRRARPLCAVATLRAGETMERALTQLWPGLAVGKLLVHGADALPTPPGVSVNTSGGTGAVIYAKLPALATDAHSDALVLLLEPVVAGAKHVTAAALELVARGVAPHNVVVCSLIATPHGLERLCRDFESACGGRALGGVCVGSLDAGLNADGLVLPGVGDISDRYFGTD